MPVSSLLSLRVALFTFLAVACAGQAAPVRLFDGKTFTGWEGDTAKTWRIVDGTIVGGSLEGNPQNEFLATTKRYKNFVLNFEYRLVGTEGFVNGGVQFRSERMKDPAHEMFGYQADIGAGYTGALYDESRRKRMLATPDKGLITQLEKPGEWNRYQVRAAGPSIMLSVNGRRVVEFSETEPGIAKDGLIALQIHGKCKAEIAFRNISIDVLPDDLVPSEEEVLSRFGEGKASNPIGGWEGGRFALGNEETVVFTGQTNSVREQKAGAFESLLATGFAPARPRFRHMAWEADTVYEQWRDLNFGSWKNQLDTVGATVVFAQFGQFEALDGLAKLPAFTAAYARLLDQFASRTQRIVLLSPLPFERPAETHAPDLSLRNADAAAYSNAVKDLATARGLVFIDLLSPLLARPPGAPRLTDNGMHLTDSGLQIVAQLLAEKLGVPTPSHAPSPDLKAAIVEKNRLFFDCWRPANWSFVYGDRVSQLFGKTGGDLPSLRESFEKHKPLVAALEQRIHALAARQEAPTKLTFSTASTAVMPPNAEAEAANTPEAELAAFTVADGYEVSLFASERESVIKPIQMVWDEKGRLYVACSPTYPHVLPGVSPGDFIVVLEDANGDGRAEKSWRFAEGFTMVQGLELRDGGLYVCDFDSLLHLRDTDGDGRADQRRTLFSGFGVGDTHQLINSITNGPDGSLWFTQGLHAFSRVETPWGLARLDKAGLWRFNPRTLKFDGFFSGAKAGANCWGVAFDDFQQVFHKSGDRPEGYYSVPGLTPAPAPLDYHPVGALFQSSPKTTALDIIGTAGLPDDVQGCAVIGGYFGSVMELHRFEDDGAGYRTTQLPKLLKSSTTAFRPVDVSVGPDGAIYAADWYNPIIGHYQASYADPRRDKTHGRIWRISAKGRPRVQQPALAGMSTQQLVIQLGSPERWTRDQARRLLFDAPTAEVRAALDVFAPSTHSANDRLRLERVGILAAHQIRDEATIRALLSAPDYRIRAAATRSLAPWLMADPEVLALVRQQARDPHPRVRLEAVVASSWGTRPEAITAALEALDSPTDRFIQYGLTHAAESLRGHWAAPFAAGQLQTKAPAHAQYLQKLANARPVAEHPGKAVYDALCLNCHQPAGNGLAGIYPPLVGSEWVTGSENALIRMLLHGLAGPITVNGQKYGEQTPVPMPPSGLEDQQIADVLSYIRNQFGNQAPAIALETVKKVRAQDKNRTAMWTAEELKQP